MKILVTGGAGFIGSHVVDLFIAEGHKVLVIDNLSTGREENLHAGADFERADVLDFPTVERVINRFRPDFVDHFAAQIDVRSSVANPIGDAQVNLLASAHLFSAAVKHGVRGILLASSGGTVYGETPLPAAETAPKAPLCPYAAAKLGAEGYLFTMTAPHQTTGWSLRYGNVYGPRQDPKGEAGVVSIFAEALLRGTSPKIFGDGCAVRDYIFVGDVAEANRRALEHILVSPAIGNSIDGSAFNIATGQSTSVNDLLKMETEALGSTIFGKHVNPRAGELQESRLDIRRAEQRLGFRAAVSLPEGIQETVSWIRSQGL